MLQDKKHLENFSTAISVLVSCKICHFICFFAIKSNNLNIILNFFRDIVVLNNCLPLYSSQDLVGNSFLNLYTSAIDKKSSKSAIFRSPRFYPYACLTSTFALFTVIVFKLWDISISKAVYSSSTCAVAQQFGPHKKVEIVFRNSVATSSTASWSTTIWN